MAQSNEAERRECEVSGDSRTVGADAEPWLEGIGRSAQSGVCDLCDLSVAESESLTTFAAQPCMNAVIVAACCDRLSLAGCLDAMDASSMSLSGSGDNWCCNAMMARLESAMLS